MGKGIHENLFRYAGLKMIKQNFYNSPHVSLKRWERGYIGHDSTLTIRTKRSQVLLKKHYTEMSHTALPLAFFLTPYVQKITSHATAAV